MDALGAAANIIAVADLAAKVTSLCLWEVAGARAEIEPLHTHIKQLGAVLQAAKQLVEERPLGTSKQHIDPICECTIEPETLEQKLALGASGSCADSACER